MAQEHWGVQTQPTMRSAWEPAPGDVVMDRYMILRVIGRGGMGLVHEARHVVTGKRVALKWLLSATPSAAVSVYRMLREARASARVDHPSVVAIYDVNEHNGRPFLVMEYLEGLPLSAVLDATPLDHGRLLAALEPVLEALALAHERGVVHRDLKPENLFLCADEQGRPRHAKLLDFGISKLTRSTHDVARGPAELWHDEDRTLTGTGCVLGTLHYMAPEQVDDARSSDQRADVYAFGVILYQALAGVRPFDADSYSKLVLRITSSKARRIGALRPDLPAGLARVIMRAISRRAQDRFKDARALLTALRPFAASAPYELADLSWRDALRGCRARVGVARTPTRRRRQTVSWVLAGACLALWPSQTAHPGAYQAQACMPVPERHESSLDNTRVVVEEPTALRAQPAASLVTPSTPAAPSPKPAVVRPRTPARRAGASAAPTPDPLKLAADQF